jgi:hypothetical protein
LIELIKGLGGLPGTYNWLPWKFFEKSDAATVLSHQTDLLADESPVGAP